MKKSILGIIVLFISTIAMKSDKPAYFIYDKSGDKSSYKELLKAASEADVVFFGEMHDNPICHWLEFELEKDLYIETGKNIIIGAEMFETDNQLLINEYLKGLIKDKNFEAEARLWGNYKTDYKPLLQFARDSALPFIATNVPRRYASMVNNGGFEALDNLAPDAKQLLPPLPVAFDENISCYKEMIDGMAAMGGHGSVNIAKAQALKDATMAYNISRNLVKGKTFLHFNGSYHSDNYEGIIWYLKRSDPDLKIVTISSVEQNDVTEFNKENENLADFIIAITETMTKTQ